MLAKSGGDSARKRALERVTNGNKSFRADGSLSLDAGFTCRKSRINPNKRAATAGGGSDLATYDFERDEVLFIGALTAAHGMARAESRVFPYNRGARTGVNYLDKSTRFIRHRVSSNTVVRFF